MEKVYIISTCIRKNRFYCEFHFKGYFKGNKIELIRIYNDQFLKGCEYLIKMVDFNIVNRTLIGKAEKFKRLN